MADTLEIFGVEYTNVTGIIATDDNGNELTYTRGGGGSVTVTDVANATGTTCVITTSSTPTPTENWEIVYRNSVGWWSSSDDDYPYCWISDSTLIQIQPTIGSVWRVTFDDNVYRLTAQAASSALPIGLGNPKYVGGTDDGSNANFCIGYYRPEAWSGNADVEADSNHFLKIERLVTE